MQRLSTPLTRKNHYFLACVPSSTGAAQILSDLDRLHADHITANENHRTVDELFHSWLANKHLSAHDTGRLTSLLNALREIYARHIDEEETQVFPHAARVLTPDDLRAVGLEMARRRGLD